MEERAGQGERNGLSAKATCPPPNLPPGMEADLTSVGCCRDNGGLGRLSCAGVIPVCPLALVSSSWWVGRWVETGTWSYRQTCLGRKGQLIMMVIITWPTISRAFLGSRC